MGWLWELRTWPVELGYGHQHPLPPELPKYPGERSTRVAACPSGQSWNHRMVGLGGIMSRDNFH